MKIAIFYHCSMHGSYWQDVDKEIITELVESGLLEKSDYFLYNKRTDFENFEFPTLQALKEFSDHNTNYAILYLHTKGISYKFDKQSVKAWRKCMLHFLVDKHYECLYKIANGFDAVGCRFIKTPMPHFQGNFWWTTSKHVKNLCNPRELKMKMTGNFEERHKAEMWLLSHDCNYYNIFDWKVNPYIDLIPDNYKQLKTF